MGKPYRPKDHFFKKAKDEGFRARSAFKLEELSRRFHLFKKSGHVLDLGAAPGGFLQIIAEAVGPRGFALGIDLVPIKAFTQPWIKTAALNVLDDDFRTQLRSLHDGAWDAVISDMAPKTSGIRATDEARSLRLADLALTIALEDGKPGSSFATKLFMGGDFEDYRARMRAGFEEVKVVRPEATRGASIEVYLVGLGKKP